MPDNTPINIVWLRRDLRLDDNAALYRSLKTGTPTLLLFIFDTEILGQLADKYDKRVLFLYKEIERLHSELKDLGSSIMVKIGSPLQVWADLIQEKKITTVYTNHDFEPYATDRDTNVQNLLAKHNIGFKTYKDHVIFEKGEVLKDDGKPYTVFTPFSRKWKAKLKPFYYKSYPTEKYFGHLHKTKPLPLPSMSDIGFMETDFVFPGKVVRDAIIKSYDKTRDFPAIVGTSHLGIHLRFGTLSIRKLLAYALTRNQTFVNELIWRDFYQQILWHFPHVAKGAFKPIYDTIEWVNDETHFKKWCEGKTGYPLVDAGMRELNETGYMHNRVRMVVASFLTKHLLIDWRWGEAYFAEKLLDFDLAANNGGWQWAAGSGTDAAPYFRIFNPTSQMEKFDPKREYIKKWIPELLSAEYPKPIVNHEEARKRCLEVYKKALKTEEQLR